MLLNASINECTLGVQRFEYCAGIDQLHLKCPSIVSIQLNKELVLNTALELEDATVFVVHPVNFPFFEVGYFLLDDISHLQSVNRPRTVESSK